MQKSDKVMYVPHITHALERGDKGEYPWVHSWKFYEPRQDRDSGEIVDDGTKELTHSELAYKLRLMLVRQHERIRLTAVRPAKAWPATVEDVYQKDGVLVADLDCPHGTRSFVTLGIRGVPVVNTPKDGKLVPHTCFAAPQQIPNQTREANDPAVVQPVAGLTNYGDSNEHDA